MYCCINGFFRKLHHKSAMNIILGFKESRHSQLIIIFTNVIIATYIRPRSDIHRRLACDVVRGECRYTAIHRVWYSL